jgi:acetyl-CoA acetyltransferase
MIAGGVESMSRAPFVMPKADSAFSRSTAIHDTTLGWRFVNPLLKKLHDTHSMAQTADNVAADFSVARADQDAFALRSQQRWGRSARSRALCRRDHSRPPLTKERQRKHHQHRRAPAPGHDPVQTGQA